MLVEFFGDTRTPLPAEALFRKIPAATDKGGDDQENEKTRDRGGKPARKSRLSILRGSRYLRRRFQDGRHFLTATKGRR